MKKISIIILVVLVVLCFGVDNAKALTISELQAQIAVLQAQLNAMISQQGEQKQWCHTFNTNMGYGATGSDFDALITILDKEGIADFTTENRPSAYDETIGGAVVKLQEKYGILRTGYVGVKTRAKLNALYGCGVAIIPTPVPTQTTCIPNWTCNWGPCINGYQSQIAVDTNKCLVSLTTERIACPTLARECDSTKPSVTVLSPNGGESWQKETVQTIKWQDTDTTPTLVARSYDIFLSTYCPSGAYCPTIAPSLIATGIRDNMYQWKVGVSVGSYIVKVCETGTTRCDSSDSYFKITSATTQPTATISTSSQITNTIPYIIGTATGTNQVGIVLRSSSGDNVYGSGLIPVTNGNWSVTVTPALSLGQYTIYVYDANNNLLTSKTITIIVSQICSGGSCSSCTSALSCENITGCAWNYSTLICSTSTQLINGVCGSATGVATATAPTANLCSAGTSGFVSNNSGLGFWMWPCTGLNGGTTASCNAPITATQPKITILSPNGGESWQKETVQTIKWQDTDTTPTLVARSYDIFLSTYCPSGAYCPTIAPSLIATGIRDNMYQWKVGVSVGSYIVKVCETGTTRCDSSDSYFKITSVTTQPTITVTSPNGGEQWQIGDRYIISWTGRDLSTTINNYHASNNIDIELTKAGSLYRGLNYSCSLISANSSGGSANCTIPADVTSGSDYKIVMIDNAAVVFDSSDNYFTIASATTQPVNGACGTAAQNYTSTATGFTGPFCVAGTVSPASPAFPLTGLSTTWTCQGVNGGATATCTATRAAATQPKITVLSPNGGESWQKETVQTIKWQDTDTTPTLVARSYDIFLSTYCPSGAYCPTIAPSLIATGVRDNMYQWKVGVSVGSYIVKVCEIGTTRCDSSDSYFKITSVATQPVNGACGTAAQNYTSTATGFTGPFCVAGTVSPASPAFPLTGLSTTWTCQGVNGGVNAICTATRAASTQPTITIISPNGGESWQAGTTHNITWQTSNLNSGDIGFIKIWDMSNPNPPPAFYVDNILMSSGSYSWSIPSNFTPGSTYKAEVYDLQGYFLSPTSGSNPEDISDNYFTIISATTQPTNGACGSAATTYTYTGSTTIINSNMCSVGTASPSSVTLSATGGSTISWTCQGVNGGVNAICTATRAASTQPKITVLSPNGGEAWQIGSTQTIKWQDTDTTPTLVARSYDIFLSTYCPSGAYCPTIAPSLIATGIRDNMYQWKVGVSVGSYIVKVCETGTTRCDSSDSYFKITSVATQPVINSLSASSGVAGTTIIIYGLNFNTSVTNTVTFLDSTHDSGFPGTTSSDGKTVTFTVPNSSQLPSGIYSIMVENTLGQQSNYVSFTITATQPKITVLSPNGGESWQIGTTYNVMWTSSNMPNVDVSINLFDISTSEYYGISPLVPVSAGSWQWMVPATFNGVNLTNKQFKMFISYAYGDETGRHQIADYSDSYFTIASVATQPTNGVCGSANKTARTTAPTTNLCAVGTASSVLASAGSGSESGYGTGPWNWTCSGSNGGTTASCSALVSNTSDSLQYCGRTNCVPKLSIVTGAGVTVAPGEIIDTIKVAVFNGPGGSFVVPCPTGTNYRVCVENTNDGNGNYVLLGVRASSPTSLINSQDVLASISAVLARIAQEVQQMLAK